MNNYTSIKKILSLLLFNTFLFSSIHAHFTSKNERKPLKILVVESYFPPVSSTAGLNQITGFLDENIIAGDNKLKIHIYSRRRGPMEWAHPNIEKYKLMDLVTFETLPENLDDYDIIYCLFGYRGKEVIDTLRTRRLHHAKIIVCFRGADITKYVKGNPSYYRKLFRKGDLFLPVCDYFTKKLKALGCPEHKIKVHHSAIDCSFFKYKNHTLKKNDAIKLISVGRLVNKKGLEDSIAAAAQLIKKYPQMTYTIVGFGPLKEDLEKLIISLGAQNNIKLVGRLSQEEIVTILDDSDIFISPSVTDPNGDQEGIANSLKEAMAMGLPVIATFHAGTPELIENGISGFLVPEKNPQAIVEKIEYLINNPDIWETLCTNARHTIEQEFENTVLNKKLISIFYSLINNKIN